MTDAELRTVLESRVASVRERIAAACQRAGRDASEVTLVAVTKTVSPRVAGLLPELGVLDLGESRPQELWRKAEALHHLPIHWHLVGHLQRNKVERTLPLTYLIQSVDSPRLYDALTSEASKRGMRPRVLLQVNSSHEEQKHGFDYEELAAFCEKLLEGSVLEVAGLMGMASLTENLERARTTFAELRRFHDQLRSSFRWIGSQLSMGMSNDFEVAVEEGATLVRVGTTIFEGLEAE